MNDEPLNSREKVLFDALKRENTPPLHLEDKIIDQLSKNNLIKTNQRADKHWIGWIGAIAASLIMFYLGTLYHQPNNSNMTIEPTKGYMLILHEDETFTPGEPMDMFNEYKAWMENTFEKGVKITGQELKNEAIIVDQAGERIEDIANRTTGYFILEANSLEDAVSVAKANPHVKYGGSIEVKPYMVR